MGDCGGNAKAAIGRLGAIEQCCIIGTFQRGGQALIQFDGNHREFALAITFDELNASH